MISRKLLGFISFVMLPVALSADYKGSLTIKVANEMDGPRTFEVYLSLRIGTLLGELVECSRAACIIDDATRITTGTNKSIQSSISPSSAGYWEAVKKIRISSLQIRARVESKSIYPNEYICITTDPGAMESPYFEEVGANKKLFRELLPSERKPYMSFNVPGSPEWSKYFKIKNRGDWEYLSADRAKQIVKDGFTLVDAGVLNFSFDISELYRQLFDEEKVKIVEQEKNITARMESFQAKRKVAEEAQKNDFWNTSNNWQRALDKLEWETLQKDSKELEESKNSIMKYYNNVLSEKKYDLDMIIERKNNIHESAMVSFARLKTKIEKQLNDIKYKVCGPYPEKRFYLTLTTSSKKQLSEQEKNEAARKKAEADEEEARQLKQKQDEWKRKMDETEYLAEIIDLRRQLDSLESDFLEFQAMDDE